MFGIRNVIPRNKTVDKAEHGVLNGTDGIEMPTMTDCMLWTINCMWLIGAHDPKKVDVSSNKDG